MWTWFHIVFLLLVRKRETLKIIIQKFSEGPPCPRSTWVFVVIWKDVSVKGVPCGSANGHGDPGILSQAPQLHISKQALVGMWSKSELIRVTKPRIKVLISGWKLCPILYQTKPKCKTSVHGSNQIAPFVTSVCVDLKGQKGLMLPSACSEGPTSLIHLSCQKDGSL